MLNIFKNLLVKKNNIFIAEPDSLETSRQADLVEIKKYLEQDKLGGLYGNFFIKHWDSLSKYLRLESYHKDVFFVKHDEVTRSVFLLISGQVLAYVVDNQVPKPIPVYTFKPNNLISELAALFNSQWHYGLQTLEDCVLISIDLKAMEGQEISESLYTDLIDLLYGETGKLCAEIYNYMLKNKIDLEDLLGKHNLFADVKQLSKENLNKLADSIKYIFLPSNQVLIDSSNRQYLYVIESGSVEQIKIYDRSNLALSYIENSSLTLNKSENLSVTTTGRISKKLFKSARYNFQRKLISSYDLNWPSQDKSIVTIKESVSRYGTIGEENLNKFSNIDLVATTKSACVLIEFNIDSLVQQDSMAAQMFGFFNNKVNKLEEKLIK